MRIKDHRSYYLDLWRGFAVIAMVIYHALYNLVIIYGFNWDGFRSLPMYIFQQSIGLSFSIMAGIGLAMSRRSLSHGLNIFGVALVVTLVTHLLMPSQGIYFGVLHMLGLSLILLSLIKKNLKKIPQGVAYALTISFFLAFWPIGQRGLLRDAFSFLQELPIIGIILGFPPETFSSSDYYPLLPWIGAVAFGFYLKPNFPLQRKIGEGLAFWEKIPLFVGQHALLIYLIHQPILLALLFPISHFFA